MDAVEALKKRGGVARVDAIRRDGVTAHGMRRARESGAIVGIRRGWVALRDADTMLIAAARRGVVLSCVTLASRKGLWVLDSSQHHLAAPANAGHIAVPRGVIHWNRPLFPRDPDALEDSLENALIIMSGCQPYESALATWESVLRRGDVDAGVLERAPLPPAARRLLADARPFADAGTETIFFTRLRWLRVRITPQVWLFGHRVDFVIGDRLVIQIDGGHHVGAQRDSDNAHDALLRLHGYHVIRISYHQLMERWPEVQSMILAAIAQRLHLAA
ncbi:endonuclease domain-containing protein [Microbacterium hydrocarbonoxydans]|uniref:endonuclease domain-containing protein n=1 Tax=Microbacterium hydrocarbonoxydans TaxID=273678 RepID=UPI003D973B46